MTLRRMQQGISLLEVMIVLSLLGAFIAGAAVLLKSYTEVTRQVTKYKTRFEIVREMSPQIDCTATVRAAMQDANCADQIVPLFDAYGNQLISTGGRQLGEETMFAFCDGASKTIRYKYSPNVGVFPSPVNTEGRMAIVSRGYMGFCRNELQGSWNKYAKSEEIDAAVTTGNVGRADSPWEVHRKFQFQPTSAFCTATHQKYTHGGESNCSCDQSGIVIGVGSVTVKGKFYHSPHLGGAICKITLSVIGK